MSESSEMKSHEVINAIFDRYKGPEWVRFSEVANGTGANIQRRADAICMNIWPSGGYAVHGFEVKVSRADFLSEMKHISKAEEIKKYCDFWWLVCPKNLVSADEVPHDWGLMEVQRNGLRIRKQAQKLDSVSLDKGFVASVLRSAQKRDESYILQEIEKQVKSIEADINRRMEVRLELKTKQHKLTSETNKKWIEDFEKRLGVSFSNFEDPCDIADRLKLASIFTPDQIIKIRDISSEIALKFEPQQGE